MQRALQEVVWSRANRCCEYCCIQQARDELGFQIDHVIALQHRGLTVPENLALAYYSCNHYKGPNLAGFDTETGNVVPLFNPRRDRWSEHFCWAGPELMGLTAADRVTVHVLSINERHRVEFRQALIDAGEFPP